jgi:copper(I)-binding protein
MVMEKDVAKMRAVPRIEVRAGKGADLKPGGYHVMLMQLKRQLKEGESVPITLVFEGRDGKRETVELQAPVRPLATPSGQGHGHGEMKH